MHTFIILVSLLIAAPAWSIAKPPSKGCDALLAGLSDIDPSIAPADFRANNVSFDPTFDPRTNISLNQDKAILFSFVDQLDILQVGDLTSISNQLREFKYDEFKNYSEQLIGFEVERDELAAEIGVLVDTRINQKETTKKNNGANDNFDLTIEPQINIFKETMITTNEQKVFAQRVLNDLEADHTHQVLDTLFYTLAGQADPKYAQMYSDIYFGREGKHFKTIDNGLSITPNSQTVHLTYSMPFEAHDIHYSADGFSVVETSELETKPTLKKLLRIFAILRLNYTQQLAENVGDSLREYYHLVQYFSQVNAQAIMELIDNPSIGAYKTMLNRDGIGMTNLEDIKAALKNKLSYRIKTQSQEFSEEPQLLQQIKGKLQDQKMVDTKKVINSFTNSFAPKLEASLGQAVSADALIKKAGAALSEGDIISYEIYTKLLTGVPADMTAKQKMDKTELFQKERQIEDTMFANAFFNTIRRPYLYSSITVHDNNEKPKPSSRDKLTRKDLTVISND